MSAKISVLLPTFNNAAIIRPTLECVKWADEILVVDSFSTDETLDICREYGARIIQHEYINSASQKNWAIPQCAHEWVLQIDSDEVLESGAKEEICSRLAQASPELQALGLPRKNHVLGQWLRSGNLYPDFQVRVFRRDAGRFEEKQVHAHIQVPGRVEMLQHHVLHYGMTSISKQLSNLDRYSRYQALELHNRGKRFGLHQLVFRPPLVFLYYFVLKRGFAAGARGFWIAALDAAFDFWSHAKLWELKLNDSPSY